MPKIKEHKKYRAAAPYEPRRMSDSATTFTTPPAKPLLVYFDFETTGLDVFQEHIIEIGAMAGEETFSSYVYTSRRIDPMGKIIICLVSNVLKD